MAKIATLKVKRALGTGGHNAHLSTHYCDRSAYGPTPECAIRALLNDPALRRVYRPYVKHVLDGLIDWTYSYTDAAVGIGFNTIVL